MLLLVSPQSWWFAWYCRLQSSYGFVDYFDRHSAAFAIVTLNGRQMYVEILNWVLVQFLLVACFNLLSAVLGSLLKLTGLMLAARERIHQVTFLLSHYFQLSFLFSFILWNGNFIFFLHFNSGHFNIFVGDLSPEVTDATLFACFSVYPSIS